MVSPIIFYKNNNNLDSFEYLSDWLDSLSLIDHLGSFAKLNLTYTSDIKAARLTRTDLEVCKNHSY